MQLRVAGSHGAADLGIAWPPTTSKRTDCCPCAGPPAGHAPGGSGCVRLPVQLTVTFEKRK